jgi:hypothetical protein
MAPGPNAVPRVVKSSGRGDFQMLDNQSFGKRIVFGLVFGILFWGTVAVSTAYHL